MTQSILSVEDINLSDVWAYVPFCNWLYENGWERYDQPTVWLNMSEPVRPLKSITSLFAEFREENPKYFP